MGATNREPENGIVVAKGCCNGCLSYFKLVNYYAPCFNNLARGKCSQNHLCSSYQSGGAIVAKTVVSQNPVHYGVPSNETLVCKCSSCPLIQQLYREKEQLLEWMSFLSFLVVHCHPSSLDKLACKCYSSPIIYDSHDLEQEDLLLKLVSALLLHLFPFLFVES